MAIELYTVNDNVVSLDWLTFNFLLSNETLEDLKNNDITILEIFLNELPELEVILKDGIKLNFGTGYYDTVFQWNDNIRLSFDGFHPDRGVSVAVPSHGLHRLYQAFFNDEDYSAIKLLNVILERGCRVNRIDICIDDFTKKYTPRYYAEKMEKGEICSRFRYWSFMSSCQKDEADTIYFGKRSNDKFVRIYNKSVQSDGEIDSIRYELELHKKQAQAFVTYLCSTSIDEFDFGSYWVNNIFRVVNRTNDDAHRCNDKLNEEWYLFVKHWICRNDEVDRTIRIKVPKVPVSFEKLDNWIREGVLPSLASYADCVGIDEIINLINACTDRKTNHKFIIADYESYLRSYCIK